MRFSIITITSVAVAAVNAIETAGKLNSFGIFKWDTNGFVEVPGYAAIPKAATNKYSQNAAPAIPDFATGSFEPTYMPEEDLHPNAIHARSVTSASTTAQPTSVADEPADGSYEAFVQWMDARLSQETPEAAATSHVARSVAPSPSAKADIPDVPEDGTYEAFSRWMEALYPDEKIPEETKQNLHARVVSTPAKHAALAATANASPVDDSYESFKHWMKIRFPHGIPQAEEHGHIARSVSEHDDYPSEEYHDLHARSVEDHEHEEPDWSQYQEHDDHLHARSTQDDYDSEQDFNAPAHGGPIEARSETENEFAWGGTFEEFLASQGMTPEQFAQESNPTESHEEAPQAQAPVEAVPEVSEVAASPAAAPTPKPTSAVSSSATTSTSASQWTGETATASSGSATNVQARSVSTHRRFRHHSAHASESGTATASSATSSTTSSRKGFFNLPW
jgi:hypothetical protein